MKLVNANFENQIIFNGNIKVLAIENQINFYKLCSMLREQIDGSSEGDFVLSDNAVEVPLEKNAIFFYDYFNFPINDKKLINQLYIKLKNIAFDEDCSMETNQLNMDIAKYISKIISLSELPLEYNDEVDVVSFFKFLDIKFVFEETTLLSKMIEFLNFFELLCPHKLYIFLNIKNYLSNDDVLEFYKFCKYNGLNVLIIENEYKTKLENEDILLIDNDFCELTF